MSIERLKAEHPFPADRPDLDFDPEGWCHEQVQEALRTIMPADATVLMELGSWLGKSARVILDHARDATLICIDHWRGSKEHQAGGSAASDKLPLLYDQFIRNMWDYRGRVIPVVAATVQGMTDVARCGVLPDAIYVDASHDQPAVYADIRTATALFPGVPLIGDDWPFPTVRQAVWQAERDGLFKDIPHRQHGQFWWGCTLEKP